VLHALPPAPRRRFAFSARIETLLLATSLFWVLVANRSFFAGALEGRAPASGWGFAAALGLALTALNFLLLAPLATRWTVKPLLALLVVGTAFASWYIGHYGIYLDPSMMRNVVRTDWREASELFGWAMLPHLALTALLPLLVLWRWTIVRPRSWLRAATYRAASIALALAAFVGAVLAVYQPLASLMRNRTELRYLITPGNYLWSLAVVAGLDTRTATGPKRPIGVDAAPGPRFAARTRPTVLVLVVGETARAANWGLNGYARQTTPELAQLPVIAFSDVTACGTNTEVSLPCMFAPVGRRDYDEARIRGSESLLQMVARAGVGVRWRDNQSGCKGVCDGLPAEQLAGLDEGLLDGLGPWLRRVQGTQLLVLHPLGNHGPAYFRRYPAAFKRFVPACENDDLQRCTREQIVNAYDNALLYTDHVLAALVRTLQAASPQVDSALVFVSDHGESLGENNLFLHGLPYSIAPDVQKKVPMLVWLSDGFAAANGIDRDCLRRRAAEPASHDHLFHTLLALLDVHSALYDARWDLTHGCRAP